MTEGFTARAKTEERMMYKAGRVADDGHLADVDGDSHIHAAATARSLGLPLKKFEGEDGARML